jgi:hypothetical protein
MQLSDRAATKSGAQADKSGPPISTWPSPVRVLRRWWWRSRLRVLLPEFRNLIRRIRWVLEIRDWKNPGYRAPLPSLFQLTSIPEPLDCKRAYIEYMQQITARHPSLTWSIII